MRMGATKIDDLRRSAEIYSIEIVRLNAEIIRLRESCAELEETIRLNRIYSAEIARLNEYYPAELVRVNTVLSDEIARLHEYYQAEATRLEKYYLDKIAGMKVVLPGDATGFIPELDRGSRLRFLSDGIRRFGNRFWLMLALGTDPLGRAALRYVIIKGARGRPLLLEAARVVIAKRAVARLRAPSPHAA